jgi:hypothetical protein
MDVFLSTNKYRTLLKVTLTPGGLERDDGHHHHPDRAAALGAAPAQPDLPGTAADFGTRPLSPTT